MTTRAGRPSDLAISIIATAYCSWSPTMVGADKSLIIRSAPCPAGDGSVPSLPCEK